MNKWTKTADGFCSEKSDLGLRPQHSVTFARLPNGSTYGDWKPHGDRDGDITHWTAIIYGQTYTIFND